MAVQWIWLLATIYRTRKTTRGNKHCWVHVKNTLISHPYFFLVYVINMGRIEGKSGSSKPKFLHNFFDFLQVTRLPLCLRIHNDEGS